jgi:hypothetical protein
MKIHLTRTSKLPKNYLQQVADVLVPHAGPMEFITSTKAIVFENPEFLWEDMFKAIEEYRIRCSVPDDHFVVCITDLRNRYNWFSTFDPAGKNNIFVQCSEWEYYVYAEQHYPVAFEVLINVLQRIIFEDFEEMLNNHPLIHRELTGCINDLCENKSDVSFKMRTADICNECIRALQEKVTDRAFLTQSVNILESLRRGMIQSAVYLNPPSFEESLPFTVAITKRKMAMSSQSVKRFMMMIDHFDSLIRTAVIMLANVYFPAKDEVEGFFRENKLSERPALGTWVSALKQLSRVESSENGVSLPHNLGDLLADIIRLEQNSKIVSIRNNSRGHGYIDCGDAGYKDEYERNLLSLEQIEKQLRPLFNRFHYYFVERCDRVEDLVFQMQVIDLSGSNPAFIEKKVEVVLDSLEQQPSSNKCYLASLDNKKWIRLDPYLKYGNCPACGHSRLLVQDGELYLDPLIGHRVESVGAH